MKTVIPHIHLIAATKTRMGEVKEWLKSIGVEEYPLPEEFTENEGSNLVRLIAKRSYMSYEVGLNLNVTKIRLDLAEFIENILLSKHGSVFEHVSYTFAIECVSRIFTAEMNRHRAGTAITEGSMRFILFTNIPYWVPNSILPLVEDSFEVREAKMKTQIVFDQVFKFIEDKYDQLLSIWNYDETTRAFSEKKKLTSLFRRIVPMGVASGGVWTGNLRSLRHIFTMRCSPAAEEEICMVASLMLDRIIREEPVIFSDFHKENGFWKPIHLKV